MVLSKLTRPVEAGMTGLALEQTSNAVRLLVDDQHLAKDCRVQGKIEPDKTIVPAKIRWDISLNTVFQVIGGRSLPAPAWEAPV
jgi:hypothetical protein